MIVRQLKFSRMVLVNLLKTCMPRNINFLIWATYNLFTLEEWSWTIDELNLNSYLTNAFILSQDKNVGYRLKDKNIEQEPRTVSKVKDKEQI